MNHAQRRAAERYGLELSEIELGRICGAIQRREDVIYETTRHGAEIWKVRVKGVWTFVVYLPRFRQIATFLTAEQARRKTAA